jgi:hypothetical protein
MASVSTIANNAHRDDKAYSDEDLLSYDGARFSCLGGSGSAIFDKDSSFKRLLVGGAQHTWTTVPFILVEDLFEDILKFTCASKVRVRAMIRH